MEAELRSISNAKELYERLTFGELFRLLSHASFYNEDWSVILGYFPSI